MVRQSFDLPDVGIGHVSADGHWIVANKSLGDLLGCAPEDLTGRSFFDIWQESDAKSLASTIETLRMPPRQIYRARHQFRNKTGKALWGGVKLQFVPGNGGGHFVLILEDVTEQVGDEESLRRSEERMQLALRATEDGIWDFDLQTDELYLSPRFKQIQGFKDDELPSSLEAGKGLIHPADLASVRALLRSIGKRLEKTFRLECRMRHRNGHYLDALIRGFVVFDERGAPVRMVGTHVDRSAQKRQEQELRYAATLFNTTKEGIVITDTKSRILSVNPAFCVITGYSQEEANGQNLRFLRSGRHDGDFYRDMFVKLESEGFWQGEIWNRRKSGDVFPEMLRISSVYDQVGTLINYVGIFSDITQAKESESRLDLLLNYDPLTGLPNRQLLQEQIDHSISRARKRDTMTALLLIDLDRFKTINDSLGHLAGDELLQQTAHRLGERLHGVGKLSRAGGDEFYALIDEVFSVEQAGLLAQQIIADLYEPFFLSGNREVYAGASIGISLFPQHGETPQSMIQHAEIALYQAKADGRGTHCFYHPKLTATVTSRLDLETRLRKALDRGELTLHYQPLISIQDGRFKGCEALLRWNDPVHGMISPADFIPLAEDTGLIIPIGEFVLRTACARMKRWLDAGARLEVMAVNLSARQFSNRDIANQVKMALKESGLPGRYLELEITESALMSQAQQAQIRLEAMKALDVRFAIDDFGTGYSSLAYLKTLPVDKIKIDRSFIRDIPDDNKDMEIVSTIIALGRHLKLEVLAEGVETEAQLEFLRGTACDTAQGFLFSRPLPPRDIERMLGLQPDEAGQSLRASSA
jgi:diguanylate cyclase (GGDEF)-like protein/PAS domain S-box-containing protein